MRVRRSIQPATLAILLSLAGCRFSERPEATTSATSTVPRGTALPALRLLDDAHAAEFRQAFDASRDQARYIVALSPT